MPLGIRIGGKTKTIDACVPSSALHILGTSQLDESIQVGQSSVCVSVWMSLSLSLSDWLGLSFCPVVWRVLSLVSYLSCRLVCPVCLVPRVL